jgi:nicotinate-nucleotide pyrophosphorylase (carboxylating)
MAAIAPTDVQLDELVDRALAEDLGDGDVTTAATVPPGTRALATITQKAPGVLSGLAVGERVFARLDSAARLDRRAAEGEWREAGPVLRIEGDAAALLGAERTALNLLGHLGGVATLTARYVAAVRGTRAKVLDTRKTLPGLRLLEKAAVRDGGGHNQRIGLYDAILIKENHIAMAGGVASAVGAAIAAAPGLPLEVECRSSQDVDAALAAGARRLLLDNMSGEQLRAIVERVGDRAELEASGGVSLQTIGEIAATGVHWISVGALTHSAPALDLSLLLEPLP